MGSPLVSVIIPCYNSEKYLPTCFKSLDGQTYNNLHVVFVDDGSTDGTLKLIEEYCVNHPEYTVISGENRGVASARNAGLNAVKGEYFCFYDADDLVYPEHISLLVKAITENGVDTAVCGIYRISERQAEKFNYGKKRLSEKISSYDNLQALEQFFSQEKFDFLLMNKIFSSEILRESGANFLDGTRYGEEGYFFFRYLSACKKTVYYGAKTYVYVQRKNSLMHSEFNESRLDIYKNLDETERQAQENYPTVVSYIRVMRAGYSAGLLYFIRKAKYNNSAVIADIVKRLKDDVKSRKKAPKIALYKKIGLPIVACIARHVFRKHLKKVKAD